MADQDFLMLLISEGAVSRRAAGTGPGGTDGYGPANNSGVYSPVMVDGQQLTIACRVAQQSTRARFSRGERDSKDASVATLTVFTDYRTDIFERDRITVEGILYDLGPVNDPGLMHHHLEFPARRVS